jgi:osmotically-inducible protein OsmY
MVSLTGHVSHYTEEMAAERTARRVKGVHAIAEEIEVRCLGETSDEEIARRALNILKWYAMVRQDAVQVTVQKGRVTLTGDVRCRKHPPNLWYPNASAIVIKSSAQPE